MDLQPLLLDFGCKQGIVGVVAHFLDLTDMEVKDVLEPSSLSVMKTAVKLNLISMLQLGYKFRVTIEDI